MLPDIPANSIYQLPFGVFMLLFGAIGAWLFGRLKSSHENPDLAAVLARRNKAYRDACLVSIGFGVCAILHLLVAARRANGFAW